MHTKKITIISIPIVICIICICFIVLGLNFINVGNANADQSKNNESASNAEFVINNNDFDDIDKEGGKEGKVENAHSIIKNPSDLTVDCPAPVTFEVEVSDKDEVNYYEWHAIAYDKDTVMTGSSSKTPKLIFPSTRYEMNNTKFYCIIAYKDGSVLNSKNAILTFNQRPDKGILYIGEYAIEEGQTLDLSTVNYGSGTVSYDSLYNFTINNVNFDNVGKVISTHLVSDECFCEFFRYDEKKHESEINDFHINICGINYLNCEPLDLVHYIQLGRESTDYVFEITQAVGVPSSKCVYVTGKTDDASIIVKNKNGFFCSTYSTIFSNVNFDITNLENSEYTTYFSAFYILPHHSYGSTALEFNNCNIKGNLRSYFIRSYGVTNFNKSNFNINLRVDVMSRIERFNTCMIDIDRDLELYSSFNVSDSQLKLDYVFYGQRKEIAAVYVIGYHYYGSFINSDIDISLDKEDKGNINDAFMGGLCGVCKNGSEDKGKTIFDNCRVNINCGIKFHNLTQAAGIKLGGHYGQGVRLEKGQLLSVKDSDLNVHCKGVCVAKGITCTNDFSIDGSKISIDCSADQQVEGYSVCAGIDQYGRGFSKEELSKLYIDLKNKDNFVKITVDSDEIKNVYAIALPADKDEKKNDVLKDQYVLSHNTEQVNPKDYEFKWERIKSEWERSGYNYMIMLDKQSKSYARSLEIHGISDTPPIDPEPKHDGVINDSSLSSGVGNTGDYNYILILSICGIVSACVIACKLRTRKFTKHL